MAACAQDELLPPGKTDWKVSVLVGLFSFFFFSPPIGLPSVESSFEGHGSKGLGDAVLTSHLEQTHIFSHLPLRAENPNVTD